MRVLHLTKLGRDVPEMPCSVYFEQGPWKALVAYHSQSPEPPETEPSLHEATRIVAALGGFLGRKGDGEPGTKSLWGGLQRLDDLTNMYRVFSRSRAPPRVQQTYGQKSGQVGQGSSASRGA
ncbi:IS4 family transposase [Algiphilus sp. W345]|uniref:IS4 family transposase n=1 Tax=Banduia mediterranea TaxID=3075609 RepID=A0ABU2WFS4_9GAMM|nr:IS4 family transposase [Algiphilus sp. W345]MDT0496469.1 IS4 family transposase [Algiphilus sp. W345]